MLGIGRQTMPHDFQREQTGYVPDCGTEAAVLRDAIMAVFIDNPLVALTRQGSIVACFFDELRHGRGVATDARHTGSYGFRIPCRPPDDLYPGRV